MKKIIPFILFFATLIRADISVKTIDLLKSYGLTINGVGPLLVQVDTLRQRVLLANTLSSSFTVIDAISGRVANVPLKTRGLQHLKSEAMTLNHRTGEVGLIGDHSFHIINPATLSAHHVATEKQYESIAFAERSGTVFLAGRESSSLAMYNVRKGKLMLLKWRQYEERLINLNQSPPPPIRKVIADQARGQIIAVDGYSGEIFLFRSSDGRLLETISTTLPTGGRWHLAGFDEKRACLYLVIETNQRRVTTAARINVNTHQVDIVMLPELTEGVGITYNPRGEQVYIPYDNHPTLHVVDFGQGGQLSEIKLPTYGNDATALNLRDDVLYVASWAQGEIDVIDLHNRRLCKRILHKGILPHMFNMAYNPLEGLLYIPKGATAVNGSFGAALSALNPIRETMNKIYTGWAPIALLPASTDEGVLVFNNEDAMAHVREDGSYTLHSLPVEYPITALARSDGDIYLAYGAHQSYWPVVYIWDAKNGILRMNPKEMTFYDRRIPRQAQAMVEDKNNVLYFLQNSWGREEQFLGLLLDGVRDFDIGQRIRLQDEIERETTPRLLHYDRDRHRLYAVRAGEKDDDSGLLHIVDLDSHNIIGRIEVGNNPTDLCCDDHFIYLTDFSTNKVSKIDKTTFAQQKWIVGMQPLRLVAHAGKIYVLCHSGKALHELSSGACYRLPANGRPTELFCWRDRLLIAVHEPSKLQLYVFAPTDGKITLLHEQEYPYGDTRFDSGNASFYLSGQYGDAVFHLLQGVEDRQGRFWLSDFLAGKIYLIVQQ